MGIQKVNVQPEKVDLNMDDRALFDRLLPKKEVKRLELTKEEAVDLIETSIGMLCETFDALGESALTENQQVAYNTLKRLKDKFTTIQESKIIII